MNDRAGSWASHVRVSWALTIQLPAERRVDSRKSPDSAGSAHTLFYHSLPLSLSLSLICTHQSVSDHLPYLLRSRCCRPSADTITPSQIHCLLIQPAMPRQLPSITFLCPFPFQSLSLCPRSLPTDDLATRRSSLNDSALDPADLCAAYHGLTYHLPLH